jgi:hypothetical protein
MPTTRRRTARVETVQNVDDKQIAKKYFDDIMRLKADLKELRLGYKVAVMQNQRQNVLERKVKEYDNLWITKWPHFAAPDFKQRVLAHYSPTDPHRPQYENMEPPFQAHPIYNETDQPFPSRNIIKKYINWRKRGQILKVALIAKRGVINERERFPEWDTRINGMFDVMDFERSLKKLLDPSPLPYPWYDLPDNDDYDEEDEESGRPTYLNRPSQPYAITPPGSPSDRAGILPSYAESFTVGGRRRKTRGKKQRRTRKKYFSKKYRKN